MKNVAVIERARGLICEKLDPLLDGINEVSLLDFPNHGNVGDSAIWAGQMAYLRSRNQLPQYASSRDALDWQALAALRGPILLCGGGNFGDVWLSHQQFRNELLARFPNRKIVQMPQSIEFSSPEEARKARDAIHAHSDFTLCVRDRRSMEQARTLLDIEPILVPDMAFFLGPISRRRSPAEPLLLLLRTDKEKRREGSVAPQSVGHVEDWLTDNRGFYKWSQFKASLNPVHWSNTGYQLALLERLAAARLERGLSMLAKYEYVITDRLHCHVLCLLQDIPHVAMDNSYGKIGNFIKAWTTDYDGLRLADNLESAIALYRQHGAAVEAADGKPQAREAPPSFAHEEPVSAENG